MDNSIHDATPEVELKRCAEDFVYFCETYIKIHHPTKGSVPFTLHEYQKRYVKHLEDNRFAIAKKFRQGGFTTLTVAWFVWRLLFKTDERMMVLSRTDREAQDVCWIARRMISALPEFLQPNFSKENNHELHHEDTNSNIV